MEYKKKQSKKIFTVRDTLGEDGNYNNLGQLLCQERIKTIISILFCVLVSYVTYFARSLATLRLPNRNHYKPIPDLVLDNVKIVEWGFTFADTFLVAMALASITLCACHVHGLIAARRFFSMFGILMLMRTVMFPVTVLPIASYVDTCYEVPNGTTVWELFLRIVQKSGFKVGLVFNSEDYCGDYIYSGHATALILLYLNFKRYTPKSWYLIHWMMWAGSAVAIGMILLARGHYTIDVIVAYFFTTRVFWTWMTMAEIPELKASEDKRNLLSRSWWFPIFKYMEANVEGVVPNCYATPWSSTPRSSPYTDL